MSIEWIFDKAGSNMTKHSDMEYKLVAPTSEMTLLEIFERENDQNFGDARYDDSKPTTSQYDERKLKGKVMTEFMDAINLKGALKHVDAVRNPPRTNLPKNEYLDPSIPEELSIMVLTHNNGLGLLGQEFDDEQTNERNFEALVKSTGLNQKQNDDGGGTHGVGKQVYWNWSQYGIVLFYSSLSKPYDDKGRYCSASKGSSCGHKTRFMATCRVGVEHEVDGKRLQPNGLAGGKTKRSGEDVSVSLFDTEADAIAKKLGLDLRNDSNPGLTIIIVGFRNPGQEQYKDGSSTVENLLRSAEANWFPAKISGALEVSIIDEDGNSEDWEAELSQQAKLLTWLEKGLDEEAGPKVRVTDPSKSKGSPQIEAKSTYKRIEVELSIPKDYPGNKTNNVQKSKAVLALQITDSEWPIHKESPVLGRYDYFSGSIACIRHNGMVVTYKPFIQRPVKQYQGLLLVGNSVRLFDKKLKGKLNTTYQEIGEEMLKFSEPAVHDDWIPNQFQAAANSRDDVYKKIAKTGSDRIREFIRDIETAIRNELGDVEPPKASEDASWDELSKELDFGKNNPGTGGRIITITKSSFTRVEPDKGELSFDWEVPPLTDKRWSKGASRWSLELKTSVTFADGKKQPVRLNCWNFGDLLDDANYTKLFSKVMVNYGANKKKWMKTTSTSALSLKVDEWSGEENKLEAAILPTKPIKITFKNLEIDLTGKENTSVELVIEAKEVKP